MVDASGNVQSYNDYYPYGMTMPGRSGTMGADTRYRFTGKERDVESGFDYFGARYYDSRIARWMSVDPLAGKYPGISPYVYCVNNPIIIIDRDGKEGETTSSISYDDRTRRHTITSTTTSTTSSTTQNSDGSTTTTTITTTQTTTVNIDANGNYVDSQGNQTSSTVQTTTVATKTETTTESGFIVKEGSMTNTSNSSVKPETNKIGNAISGWLKDGHSGTPFLTVGKALGAITAFSGYGTESKLLTYLGLALFLGSENSSKISEYISGLSDFHDRKVIDKDLEKCYPIDRIPWLESLSYYYKK
jgi:RHS repeat-associated protein